MRKLPNWCENTIRIQAEESVIRDIKKTVSSNEICFDFNNIIPMPKELRDTDSPNRNSEIVTLLREKYGFEDWYSWAVHNWGTKWNACDPTIIFDISTCVDYYFETAWEPPLPVIEELSRKFPGVSIEIDYDEPGADFGGSITWRDGVELSNIQGPSRFHDENSEEVYEDLPDVDF